MRKKLLEHLVDPADNTGSLQLFALVATRNGELILNVEGNQLLDEDDVASGILIGNNTVYAIENTIAILLNDADTDPFHLVPLLQSLKQQCPVKYQNIFDTTLLRLQNLNNTSDGNWNRDEMRYYDAEVATPEKRQQMVDTIFKVPVHRILIPRHKHITGILNKFPSTTTVLEIGCGNASSIFRIFRPSEHKYNYTGCDISFKRLMVAKALIPEGDFIQASALNLPFKKEYFNAVISFGMLHHLPRPIDAVSMVMPLIKQNGFFAFHEPVIRDGIKLPGINTFKKVMTTYEHSEHDGKIDLPSVLNLLHSKGFKTIHMAEQISVLRSGFEAVLKKINRKIMLNKWVIVSIEKGDTFLLNILSKFTSDTGAKAVFAVFQNGNGK